MWKRHYAGIIGAGAAVFAGLCVALLPRALVALILAAAVSVIGIAVERERRRARGH